MKTQVILADNQAIFRLGSARVLAREPELQVVAQCEDAESLLQMVAAVPGCLTLFPTSLTQDIEGVLRAVKRSRGKAVIIVEHGAVLSEALAASADGVLLRSVAAVQLVDCLHRIAAGEHTRQRAVVRSMPESDDAGARILARLTPREVQIVALVEAGMKNRQIAQQLGTKEQMVKNYLRAIYDKTGASDRLELALCARHHRTLAQATGKARSRLARSA